MAKVTRRGLMAKTGLGIAAAGVVLATPTVISTRKHGQGQALSKQRSPAPETIPTVAYVRDAAKGEVVLMVGTREIVRTDPELVAYLGRCCGPTTV